MSTTSTIPAAPATKCFEAFGGIATVAVTDPLALAPALEAARAVVAAFDRACSRFRADSELMSLAAGPAVPVSPVLCDAIAAALDAASLTDGAVDPTIGGALVALGYDRDYEQLAGRGAHARLRAHRIPGWQTVELDRARRTVRVPQDTILDLGATAKALAADRAAALAFERTGDGVLVSFSGDLAVTGEPPAEGWTVRVTDDHRSRLDAPGQTIVVRDGGLATSSVAVRRWATDGGEAHHLIDPGTGLPATGPWRTVTVAAGSCLQANVASTAAIVRGTRALGLIDAAGLPVRLVSLSGSASHRNRWPAAGEELPITEGRE